MPFGQHLSQTWSLNKRLGISLGFGSLGLRVVFGVLGLRGWVWDLGLSGSFWGSRDPQICPCSGVVEGLGFRGLGGGYFLVSGFVRFSV